MPWSESYLVSLAEETGFRKQTLEKVLRLGELQGDVSRHPLLSSALALKGGTALNLCFGAPTRLSVDLDFNYIGSGERARMIEDRPLIEKAVHQIAKGRGYQVQNSRDEHAGRKYFLTYVSSSRTPDRVELDLNFLYRVPILPLLRQSLWQPGGGEVPVANTVSLEEICAGKLCALLDRSMARDLYDASRLPIVAPRVLASELFRALFIAMAGVLAHPVYRYGRDRLERVSDEDIRVQLHPMLSSNERPTADALRREAWNVVGPFLTLSDPEREFTDRIQYGELEPALLLPGEPALVERIQRHPALLWKAQNAREHAAKKGGRP